MPSQSSDKGRCSRTSPVIVQRKQEFQELCRIQYSLEAKKKMPTIPDSQLEDLRVIRGAPFDIEDDPIDFEPRFFLPGPVDKMEEGVRRMMEEGFQGFQYVRRSIWEVPRPLNCKKLRSSGWQDQFYVSSDFKLDAELRRRWFINATNSVSAWAPHKYVKSSSTPAFCSWWDTSEGPRWHQFQSVDYFMWPRAPRVLRYNPEVPHALGTTIDSRIPADGGLLRSELLLAVCLLKAQIRQPRWFQDHEICPALVISFHGRFSARVVQAYYHNGRLVVRASRLVNLHVPTLSPDICLLARWVNARPVGNTRRADAETPAEDEGGLVCVLDPPDKLHQTTASNTLFRPSHGTCRIASD
ncbi:Uncharacterized protein TPAR_01572 [Tolypocladium paradoxum]|uniref:Uncharacterized protein n=1 Tax=Tolypocladium paradoxum TaxID=94208 RepID=A0A2S4L717_9HYPO|nr:Uncharacterized protein TPAR_01572 [Tolypocladium paradoxum]